jgi:hypothetical protein
MSKVADVYKKVGEIHEKPSVWRWVVAAIIAVIIFANL